MFRKWLENNRVENFSFSGEILPPASNREFWDSKYKEKYIKEGEEYLGYNWPHILASDFMAFDKTGDRAIQEKPHFERRAALYTLVIAETLEHKGRFMKDIVNGILLICEESFWGVSAHRHPMEKVQNIPDVNDPYIDLFAAETGAALSIIHHLFYEELKEYCPEILTRIEYEVNHRIIKPYLARYDFIWMCYMGGWLIDNWNPWIISNLITVFLLMEKSPVNLHNGIKKMIYEINGIYETYPKDGGCDEGATYWGVSAGAMFEFCEQIYLATDGKINFFSDEIIQNIAKYEYRAYIGNGRFVNFADGTPHLTLPVNYIMYKYGQRIGDEKLSALATEIYNTNTGKDAANSFDSSTKLRRNLFDVIYEDEIANGPKLIPDETCILENTENTFVRAGEWYYAAKGGNNFERHNHHDVGSFMVYYDNKPVLVDPSCGTYTKDTFRETRYSIWTMQSGWHNTPVINSKEQIGEFSPDADPKDKTDKFTLSGKTTEIGFKKLYPASAKIEDLTRKIGICEDGIDLFDEFVFESTENTISEHFITPLDIEITPEGAVLGKEFILIADTKGTFTIERVDFCGDKKLIDCWNTDGLNRLIFCFNADNVKFSLRKCSM